MKAMTGCIMATAAFLLFGEARAQTLLSASELEKIMIGNSVRFQGFLKTLFGMTQAEPGR
jgi:hypothetical protein